ncbi:hypothetical protein R1flu_004706 [Riccia fluitans]|uniref:Uncharacterized protein n=1 Tax=Riccia fluitans TaxID=41844 RepID=A0ABD1YR27_9MARC
MSATLTLPPSESVRSIHTPILLPGVSPAPSGWHFGPSVDRDALECMRRLRVQVRLGYRHQGSAPPHRSHFPTEQRLDREVHSFRILSYDNSLTRSRIGPVVSSALALVSLSLMIAPRGSQEESPNF